MLLTFCVMASSYSMTRPHIIFLLQRLELERRDKLEEQLDEARKLRQSIFRRGDAVFAILARSV